MAEQPVCPLCVDPGKTHARYFSLCEHHSMHTLDAMAEARERRDHELAEAEQRGAARVLREVAKLNCPWNWHAETDDWERDVLLADGFHCSWCNAHVEWSEVEPTDPPHPDNGCLWLRALAAGRDEAR